MTSILLLVILGALGVSALAHHRGLQPGLVVVVIAGAVSFVPAMPRLEFEPDTILSLVMPPLLYSATVQFSFFRFVKNIRPILILGVGLVVVTTGAIGFLAAWVIPLLGLTGAFVLAAVVSPPDTVTTVTHGREIGLPARVISILTGESLVNDAAALTLFAIAVASLTGESTFIGNPFLLFGYGVVVGLVIGAVLGLLTMLVRKRLLNSALEATLSLLVPFTAFLVAEELHASGVIAVVAAGFTVSMNAAFDSNHRSPTTYSTRIQEGQMWPIVDTVLEAFVFAYMGLQLRFIVDDLVDSDLSIGGTLAAGAAILLAVIALRFAWVFVIFGRWALAEKALDRALREKPELRARVRLRNYRAVKAGHRPHERFRALGWREMVLVSWTGMRGIVTLAAAASVPLTVAGEPFEGREVIQIVAFVVAVGTLLIQGTTLPILARRLKIDLAEEDRVSAAERLRGIELQKSLPVNDFDGRRDIVSGSVAEGTIDDVTALKIIHTIDLEEAIANESAT